MSACGSATRGQDPATLIMSYTSDDGHRVYYAAAAGHKDLTNYASVVSRYYAIEDGQETSTTHRIGQGAKSSNVIYGIGVTQPTWDVRSLHANVLPSTSLKVKVSLFCNTQNQGTIYPRDWKKSIEDVLSTSALRLQVGNSVLDPSSSSSEWDGDNEGFFDVAYTFNSVPQGLVSLVWRSTTDKWFVKNITVYGNEHYEKLPTLVSTLTTDFDNNMSTEMPFAVGGEAWMYYKGQAYYSQSVYDNESRILLGRLAAQYAACRRRFRIALPVADFLLDRLVTLRGYTCTIEAAELDLKHGKVTVTLLEVPAAS